MPRNALCFVGIPALAGWLAACGHSPTAPTPPAQPPPPSPPPPPAGVAAVLTGTVTDYEGQPLPDTDVSFSSGDANGSSRSTKTDAAGHYTFAVQTGTLKASVSASRAGYSSDLRQFVVTGDAVKDLELMGIVSLNAGEGVEAELHVGPHNSICQNLFEAYSELQPCRAFVVRFDRAGTLSARLDWSGGDGLALARWHYVIVDIPGFGPEACCQSGETLRLGTTGPGELTLVVRLRDRRVAPVKFTLTTSLS